MNPACLTDMSFVPESDFFELVWEDGQIQTSRARKTQTSNNLLSQSLRIRDKATGNGINAKMGKLGSVEPVLNEVPMSVPSVEMGLNQDDDMVPWLNCPIDESLQHDCCSDFLPGLSGVIEHSSLNNFTSFDRRGGGNRPARDSHTVFTHNHSSLEQGSAPQVSSADRTSFSQLYSLPAQQNQIPFPYSRSRVLANHGDGVGNVNAHATSGDSIVVPTSLRDFPSIKTLRKVSELSAGKSSLINFSHFSKSAALVKANLQNIGMRTGFGRSSMERMETKDKGPIASSSNPAEATPLDSFSGSRKETSPDCCPIVMSPKVSGKALEVKSAKDLVLVELPDAVSQEDDSKNDNGYRQNFGGGETKGQVDVEKTTEPVVSSSSVCSGNSVERASDDPTQNLKKKHRDTEESEGPSEDVEEESVAAKKSNPTRGGTGSKRSRAAEVHNLSERRRRDRINEKMHALQELIPNCNKVDKASMLDEAIEYLKTLQLQVQELNNPITSLAHSPSPLQIMSMRAGLHMPPMMMTPGVPHMYAAHMAQFSPPLGFGNGMGMGAPNMSGGSSSCSMIQMPSMHGQHLPRPPVTGPSTLHGMGGSNLPMFGLSGHGLQMPVPRAPLIPMSGGPPLKTTTGLNVSGVIGPINNLVTAPSPGSKDLIKNMKLPMKQSNADSSSMNQTSNQVTNASFEQSVMVQNNGQSLRSADDGELKLVSRNDNRPNREAGQYAFEAALAIHM